jgi:hypothetical protein
VIFKSPRTVGLMGGFLINGNSIDTEKCAVHDQLDTCTCCSNACMADKVNLIILTRRVHSCLMIIIVEPQFIVL